MNTDLLARVTLVLDRQTADGLAYLSGRLGRSRSELAREVLATPIDAMVELVGMVPESGPVDPRQIALRGLEMIDGMVDGPVADLRRLSRE